LLLKDNFFKNVILKYNIWFYIIFFAGFFILPTRVHRNYFYIFLMAPFFLTVNFSDFKKIFLSKIFLFSFFYCIFFVISLGWADDIDYKYVYELTRKDFIVIVFLIITILLFKKGEYLIEKLYKNLCIFSGIISSVTIFLFYYNNRLKGRITGIGTLDNPITAASGYAVVVLIMFFYFLVKNEVGLKEKLKYSLAMISTVSFVVLSQSRGPLLALAVTLILGTVLFKPKHFLWILGGFILPAVAAYATGLVDFSLLISRADSYRIDIWRQSWDIFLQHPLFGYGIGGTRPAIVITKSVLAEHSHNLFLSTMLDGGVIALGLLLAVLGLAIGWSVKYFRETKDVTLLALMVFAVLSNFTDGKTPIASPNQQWLYFWLPIGLVAAYELRHRLCYQAGTATHSIKESV
jgi:O-antigen ligase